MNTNKCIRLKQIHKKGYSSNNPLKFKKDTL